MPESLSAVYVHLVFSTKHRHPFLADGGLRDEMHRYLAEISARLQSPALEVGGVADHVHLLARLGRTMAPADWVKELKRASSVWAKTRVPAWQLFAWQAGYGVFSVSQSQLERVRHYILTQEIHHAKTVFQDEFRALLHAHEVAWNEQYVWD